jgi:hypothetical protein
MMAHEWYIRASDQIAKAKVFATNMHGYSNANIYLGPVRQMDCEVASRTA